MVGSWEEHRGSIKGALRNERSKGKGTWGFGRRLRREKGIEGKRGVDRDGEWDKIRYMDVREDGNRDAILVWEGT